MFNARPFVGRDKLDVGVTIGLPDLALVTRVAVEEAATLAVDRSK